MKGTSRIQSVVGTEKEVEVMSRLNLLGGLITSVASAAVSQTAVGATVPTESLGAFKTWLHTLTGG
jgi:hypothetical protein